MFKKTVFLILSFSAMLLAAGGSQANTINMAGYGGSGNGNVTCNGVASGACSGIIGTIGTNTASFSGVSATAQSVSNSNPDTELSYLNDLLASFNPALPLVSGADQTGAGSGFTVTREYFSIKKGAGASGGGAWFFKNNSGGALTVALASGNDDYSHWTEYGETVVPVPAAVWLFGSGLLGLIGVARRRKV